MLLHDDRYFRVHHKYKTILSCMGAVVKQSPSLDLFSWCYHSIQPYFLSIFYINYDFFLCFYSFARWILLTLINFVFDFFLLMLISKLVSILTINIWFVFEIYIGKFQFRIFPNLILSFLYFKCFKSFIHWIFW